MELTAQDLARMEADDEQDTHEYDGDIIFVDARSVQTEAQGKALDDIKKKSEATIVVLPHDDADKKKMKKYAKSDAVSNFDIDHVEENDVAPGSNVFIVGYEISDSDVKAITGAFESDCNIEVVGVSRLDFAAKNAVKFFTRHSPNAGEVTPESLRERAGYNSDKRRKDGYICDWDNAKMGYMARETDGDGNTVREYIEPPRALYSLVGVEDHVTREAFGNFAMRITRCIPVRSEDGKHLHTLVDLELVFKPSYDEDRKVYRTAGFKSSDFTNIDLLKGELGVPNWPIASTREAGRALEQMLWATSDESQVAVKYHSLGLNDFDGELAFICPEYSYVLDSETGEMRKDTSIVGEVSNGKVFNRNLSVEKGDMADASNELMGVLDTLTEDDGEPMWATTIALQTYALSGGLPRVMYAIVGPGGIGKTTALGSMIMIGREWDDMSFRTTESTLLTQTEQGKGINNLPVVVDDFRHRDKKDTRNQTQKASLTVLGRIAYGGMQAAPDRGNPDGSVTESGNSTPFIVVTAENSISDYSGVQLGSDKSRQIEVAIDKSPTNDLGAALVAFQSNGHLEAIAYSVIERAFRRFAEYAKTEGKRTTLKELYEFENAEATKLKRENIASGADRSENVLARLRRGADLFVEALDGYPEAQKRVRAVFDRVEKNTWTPIIDETVNIMSSGSLTPGMSLLNDVMELDGIRLNILNINEKWGDNDTINGPMDRPILTVGAVTEWDGEVYLAFSSKLLDEAGVESKVGDNASALNSIRGVIRRNTTVKGSSRRNYFFIPVSSTNIERTRPDLLERRKPGDRPKDDSPKSDPDF